MDTSSDRTAGSANEASIRLRYSRQFQSGGHTHTIDAETVLPVGAGQERREQVLHELEADVEHLARRIVQRSARPGGETRPQPAIKPDTPMPRAMEPARSQSEAITPPARNQMMGTPPSASPVPVSENMPATPVSSGEGTTVRLPQFINAIKRRWNMSLKEAMDLLHVTTLEGANLREVYAQLQTIVEARNANLARPNPPSRTAQSTPVVEAPRQANRGSQQPAPRSPINRATSTTSEARSQEPAALKGITRPAPSSMHIPSLTPDSATAERQPRERGQEFAGSSKAPIPIQVGVVRDISSHAYKFEEEEEEDEEELELPEDEDPLRVRARLRLDGLRELRGSGGVASAGRQTALSNVMDSQLSEQQLLKIIQAVWGINTKRKLKSDQIEELISWGKEDTFLEEAEAMLALIEEEEG
jgi:hypothetical protein